MGSRIYVEWVSGAIAEKLYRKRRARALEKSASEGSLTPAGEDSWWDWVETDECLESRRFPSVGLAKGWASANASIDFFGLPKVCRAEWPGDDQDAAEVTLELELQGDGGWLNVRTGEVE